MSADDRWLMLLSVCALTLGYFLDIADAMLFGAAIPIAIVLCNAWRS